MHSGVKVLQPATIAPEKAAQDSIVAVPLPATPTTAPVSLASSIYGRTTEMGTAREGGDTERGESIVEGSRATGTAKARDRDNVRVGLGEEITSIVRRFPRVNFEKVRSLVPSPSIGILTARTSHRSMSPGEQ